MQCLRNVFIIREGCEKQNFYRLLCRCKIPAAEELIAENLYPNIHGTKDNPQYGISDCRTAGYQTAPAKSNYTDTSIGAASAPDAAEASAPGVADVLPMLPE